MRDEREKEREKQRRRGGGGEEKIENKQTTNERTDK